MTFYRRFFDTVLSRTDAETAHRVAFALLRGATPVLTSRPVRSWSFGRQDRTGRLPWSFGRQDRTGRLPWSFGRQGGTGGLPVQALGLTFPGPLGLAAGFDKNAEGIDALAALGFAFVEVGTVTAQPQPGNPTPRLFRLPEDRAVVNRMGFNNDGAEAVARRLGQRAARRSADPTAIPVVLGVNIGRSKLVPDEQAVADYEKSTRLLAPFADYLVVNVSSPNTPGLRDLQATDKLRPLLEAIRREADAVTQARVPLLVKIAPDLSDDDVLAVADLATDLDLDGIVATNTTVSREGLSSGAADVARAGAGGLSGAPLHQRSLAVLRLLRGRVPATMVIISVGGIFTAADARERLDAGANLLQAYTALVYEGALWPSRLQRDLAHLPERGPA